MGHPWCRTSLGDSLDGSDLDAAALVSDLDAITLVSGRARTALVSDIVDVRPQRDSLGIGPCWDSPGVGPRCEFLVSDLAGTASLSDLSGISELLFDSPFLSPLLFVFI